MRIPFPIVTFILVLLVVDIYVYKAIYKVIAKKSRTIKLIFSVLYFAVTLAFIFYFINIAGNLPTGANVDSYPDVFLFFAIMLMVYLPKLIILIFHLIRDVSVLSQKLVSPDKYKTAHNKGRREFITKTGIVIASWPFLGTFYGILKGRFNYKLHEHQLAFSKLPNPFNGFKIVQISDFHISCFIGNEEEVTEIVDIINNQNPDIIVFTGDMINNYSNEMDPFLSALSKLKASYGKFAITGNHDYGDYSKWSDPKLKAENFNKLLSNYDEIGFRVLRNELIKIEKDNTSFEIIGVENWGKPPFPKYGNLKESMTNSDAKKFKILLSHDPSHWKEEVTKQTNIDLTLSGHTHGMQFGIEIPGFKWSPVKFKYPQWAGLYSENDQHLYVNRGIGHIGMSARVGIMPEITLFELSNTDS